MVRVILLALVDPEYPLVVVAFETCGDALPLAANLLGSGLLGAGPPPNHALFTTKYDTFEDLMEDLNDWAA